MLSYLDSRKSLFITFYFILLFLIGIIVFKDYGISIDEDNTRINGFISLKYVFEIFAPNKVYLIDQHILLKIQEYIVQLYQQYFQQYL